MRGASYLAGIDLMNEEGSVKNIIVVDVGGTTTDIGVLLPSGFPRQAAAFIKGATNSFSICQSPFDFFALSCRSQDKVFFSYHGHAWANLHHFYSFSMPDVHSIGLGGGSRVRLAENGQVTVGPDSVGHQVGAHNILFSISHVNFCKAHERCLHLRGTSTDNYRHNRTCWLFRPWRFCQSRGDQQRDCRQGPR